MAKITDPAIWDQLPQESKVWWLKEQIKLEAQKCDRCWQFICACDVEPDYV
jgi:hypothetical protein